MGETTKIGNAHAKPKANTPISKPGRKLVIRGPVTIMVEDGCTTIDLANLDAELVLTDADDTGDIPRAIHDLYPTPGSKVPSWALDAAPLSTSGLRMPPKRLIAKLVDKLKDETCSGQDIYAEELTERAEKAGFSYHENHTRENPHAWWQDWLGTNHAGEWVIPLNEVIVIAEASIDDNDNLFGYDDFISISRLLFAGSEEELEQAIDAF